MRQFKVILFSLFLFAMNISTGNYFAFHNPEEKNNVVYLFCHGFGGDFNQVIHYVNVPAKTSDNKPFIRDYCLVEASVATFNFPEVDDHGKRNQALTDLGQEADLAELHKAYLKTREEFVGYDIVFICVSRGASAALNFVAKYKPVGVKALILESPFDHPKSIIKRLLKNYYVSWIPGLKGIGLSIMQKNFPKINFSKQGIFPRDMVKQLPNDLPIMLIHSKKDALIPVESSQRIYKLLVQSGHPNTKLVILDEGSHANILWDKNSNEYRQEVRHFLQKHNLIT